LDCVLGEVHLLRDAAGVRASYEMLEKLGLTGTETAAPHEQSIRSVGEVNSIVTAMSRSPVLVASSMRAARKGEPHSARQVDPWNYDHVILRRFLRLG